MTTLVVLVCLALGSFINARAGESILPLDNTYTSMCAFSAEPTGHGHLTVAVHSQDQRAPDVQPGNKYFASEASPIKILCAVAYSGDKSVHPVHPDSPTLSWHKVDTGDWSHRKVEDRSGEPALLVLSRVSVADAGRYDCVASHTFANLSIELFVSSKRHTMPVAVAYVHSWLQAIRRPPSDTAL